MSIEPGNPARELRSALESLRSPGAGPPGLQSGHAMLDALIAAGRLLMEGDVTTLEATLSQLDASLDAAHEPWRAELMALLEAESAAFAARTAAAERADDKEIRALLARREELEALAASADALGIDVETPRQALAATDEALGELSDRLDD